MPAWLRRLLSSSPEPRVIAAVVGDGSTLVVREDGRFRELVEIAREEMVHTRVLVDEPLCSGFAYTDALHAGLWLVDVGARALSALCLGAGGGIVARQLVASGVRTTVVESSSAVLELAREHFGLRAGPSLRIEHADALDFAEASPADRYDVAIVDLFGAFEASALLATRELFDAVRRVLRPGAAVAVNMVGPLDGTGGAMHATLRAIAAVFDDHLSVPMFGDGERASGMTDLGAVRNVVAFARRGPLPSALPVRAVPIHLRALPEVLAALDARLSALDHARAAASVGRSMPIIDHRANGAGRRAPRDSTHRPVRTAR